MPVSLKTLLEEFDYPEEKQQIAFVQLAAYRNFFGDRFKNKKISQISEQEAKELLETSFESPEEAVDWLIKKADENFLRKNFKIESVGNGKGDFINLERWFEKSIKPKDAEGEKILEIFNLLELNYTAPWPKGVKIDIVFFHGALEKFLKLRVDYIPELPECKIIPHEPGEKIVLYGTNPRMLDNRLERKTFAKIVVDKIFGYPPAKRKWGIDTVEKVLEENEDPEKSDKNWLVNPQGLKQLILDRLEEKVWPINKKSSYYKNPEPYELAAKKGPKPRPSPAGLPTAVDMIEYLFEERALVEPEFKNVRIIPLEDPPEEARVVTTADNIRQLVKFLFSLLGEKLNTLPLIMVCVTNNTYIHYTRYQKTIVEQTILELEKIYGKLKIKCITVGPGDETRFNFLSGIDVIAKELYIRGPGVVESLKKRLEKEKRLLAESKPSLVKHKKLFEKNGFFSPSQYATKESPYGPFEDYYCHPDDPIVKKGLSLSK